jgi:hypothetical protein
MLNFMKKLIILLLVAFVFKLPAFTQTYTWFDSFDSGQSWTLEENWTITDGKLEFYWTPQVPNFDLSALSSVISLSENVFDLTINQHLNVFTGTGNEFAEIVLIANGENIILWNYNLINGNWGNGNGEDITFPLTEYAGQDIQIEFRTYGNDTYNWNWWDIFEIKISTIFGQDLSVISIIGPSNIELNESGTWSVTVKNLGSEILNTFNVLLFDIKTGDMIGSVENQENLAPQQTMNIDFNWSSDAAFNTAFIGVSEFEGDQFANNNKSNSHFVRIEPNIEYSILFWDNDNGIPTVVDPDKGNEIEASQSFTNILDEAGLEYEYFNYLPDNLYDYTMILSTMGCFCVS